ncbi:MAG: hypothetical protein A2289_02950 [Deltaproteobacteria bacterium RIFOXYA12_FULL_58_15]|nr:MAG: hypothetical protein A2289_02950 [Deltaproteobacteria bacterium RIFOXYA12_FULL_58_15]OGR11457.1 MAG: hypothetical protein A2341_28315 [Deltaproteobacteria bacterium RIFOXYB12_FULL_58_9]
MARPSSITPPASPKWESTVLEAVGRVIEYWGFKRNHGRVWALLYLHDAPMDAPTLGRRLGLSKGAMSIVLRELEGWAVLRRVPADNRSGIAFAAERNLWSMLETVLRQRETELFAQVRDELRKAEEQVIDDASLTKNDRKKIVQHIRSMRRLADAATLTLQAFIRSRHLDASRLADILLGSLRR